jgi:hypothetical protein
MCNAVEGFSSAIKGKLDDVAVQQISDLCTGRVAPELMNNQHSLLSIKDAFLCCISQARNPRPEP